MRQTKVELLVENALERAVRVGLDAVLLDGVTEHADKSRAQHLKLLVDPHTRTAVHILHLVPATRANVERQVCIALIVMFHDRYTNLCQG